MIPRILIPLVFALAICMPRLAEAGTTKPKPRPTPHHVVITTISADSITISTSGGDKTYKITKNTEIKFKNDPTTVDKLQAGMRVQVTPDAVDEGTAAAILASDPPKEISTPAPKK